MLRLYCSESNCFPLHPYIIQSNALKSLLIQKWIWVCVAVQGSSCTVVRIKSRNRSAYLSIYTQWTWTQREITWVAVVKVVAKSDAYVWGVDKLDQEGKRRREWRSCLQVASCRYKKMIWVCLVARASAASSLQWFLHFHLWWCQVYSTLCPQHSALVFMTLDFTYRSGRSPHSSC